MGEMAGLHSGLDVVRSRVAALDQEPTPCRGGALAVRLRRGPFWVCVKGARHSLHFHSLLSAPGVCPPSSVSLSLSR